MAHGIAARQTWTCPEVKERTTERRKQYNQATLSGSEAMRRITDLSTEKTHTKLGPTMTPTGSEPEPEYVARDRRRGQPDAPTR